MAEQMFRVTNAAGMWLRTEPTINEATKKVLLPNGQLVKKLGDSNKADWWHISTSFNGEDVDGFSNRKLMAPDSSSETPGDESATSAESTPTESPEAIVDSADQVFRVSNSAGVWLRTEPVINDATKKALLPKGQLVTKLGDSENADWWRISTNFKGEDLEGFSSRKLMEPNGGGAEPEVDETAPVESSALIATTLAALKKVAPRALPNYLQAIQQGDALFGNAGISTPQRMAHFMAQALLETGGFTVLRESMKYSAPRMMQIFGVGHHSAKITSAEAQTLAGNDRALAERVYGLGNPKKAKELGNTEAGDGFTYRGNGVLQTTGRGAHKRMGQKCGVDFEGNPDLVTTPEHALKPALQEWIDGGLNKFADQNDIRTITKRINGGFNGLEDRKAFFAKIFPLLK